MRSRISHCVLAITILLPVISLCQQQRSADTDPYYGRPLFELNQGQASPQVRFVSHGPDYTALLASGNMVLSLRTNTPLASSDLANSNSSGKATVRLNLVGAAKNPVATGEDQQTAVVNYFVGKDPAKWIRNVPTYGRVRYRNVYPGIDLIYYGSQHKLQYAFEVHPGADARQIQFESQGEAQIGLDSAGDLVLSIGSDNISLQSPLVYQMFQGQIIPVDGAFVINDSTHLAFHLADNDSIQMPEMFPGAAERLHEEGHATRAIGAAAAATYPVLGYATYLGGSDADQASAIAVDSSGDVYLTGFTDSVDFPLATLGSLSSNSDHAFVAKFDPFGHLIYADYIGGNNDDYGMALTLDNANDVWITGSTESSNFPVINAYQSQQPGPYTGFVAEVSADGSSLLYSTYFGGSTLDQPTSIAIDSLSQIHVAGYTESLNFPVANAYQASALPNQGGSYGLYGFVSTFSANGSSLIYSTYLAGNDTLGVQCGSSTCYLVPYSAIYAIALDGSGDAYVTGATNTNSFPTTSGTYQSSNNTMLGSEIAFVSKLSSSGSLDYSTYFYGSSGAAVLPNAIAVDSSGYAFITGTATSDGTFPITTTSICDPGTYGTSCGYSFVSKFDAAAATLSYSTFLGPNNFAIPQAIAIDGADDAYVLGTTSSPSYETYSGIESYSGSNDLLVVEIDPTATNQLFSTYFGGSGNDIAGGLAVDAEGDIYIAGSTESYDLPVTQGAFQSQLAGNINTFVAKIGTGTSPTVSLTPSLLQFSAQAVGSSSSPQEVELRNMSSLMLTFSAISTTGDFAETNNCGTALAAASSCTLSVTFNPTASGSRNGSIVVDDTGTQSPQTISLTGVGLGAAVALTSSLTFPSTPVGVTSTVQTVKLSNQGNASLTIASIQVSGDYAESNNCSGSVAAGSSCTLSITFTPTATGSRSGTLTINDNAAGSPQTIALSGSGSGFTLSSAPSSATANPGATATYTITVAPVGGAFGNAVSLACSGVPAQVRCNIAPSSVTPGSNPVPVTLTLSTTAPSAQTLLAVPTNRGFGYAVWMGFSGFGVLGMLFLGSRRSPKNWWVQLGIPLLLSASLLMAACAGGTGIAPQNQTGTQPGTYKVTVAGTCGSLQQAVSVTLIVQ